MEPVSLPILPEHWAAILDSVQQALAQADAAAARASTSLDAPAANWADYAWKQSLGELEEKGRQLHACASGADLVAGEVEAALQASETALRQWLERAETIRRNLANRTAGSV